MIDMARTEALNKAQDMRHFRVYIEWIDGTVTEETVSAKTWFGFFHHAIETDDNIEHYTVDTIE